MDQYIKCYEKAKQFDYISVDIYDTLIFRTVSSPEDIWKLTAQLSLPSYVIRAIYNLNRKYAGRIAVKKNKVEDVSIDDVYKNIYIGYENRVKTQETEKLLESSLFVPNQKLIDVLLKLKNDNKTIIITTDMYLDRETITTILRKAGVPWDKLYISGEEGLTKRSGSLYKKVLSDLGIKSDKIIHIGNDANNDILMANRNNIEAFQINESFSSIYPDFFKFAGEIIESFMRIQLGTQNINNESKFGYLALGPFLYATCRFIHGIVDIENTQIWFVSREGYLLKKAYELMYPNDKEHLSYVALNKNILRLPVLLSSTNRLETFLLSISKKKYIYIKDVVKYLRLDKTVINDKIAERFGLAVEDKFEYMGIQENKSFIEVFEYLCDECSAENENYAELLTSYLLTHSNNKRRVMLVNNSHNGSGQKLLETFICNNDIDLEVIGFQFVKSKLCLESGVNCLAYLDELQFKKYEQYRFIRNCLMFEHLLFENVGTAIRLQEKQGEISVITEERNMEKKNDDLIGLIQDGALMFIKDFMIAHIDQYVDDRQFVSPLLSLMRNPNRDTIDLVKHIYDDDDVAKSTNIFGIENDDGFNLKFNFGSLRTAGWIEGYLERCGTPIIFNECVQLMMYLRSLK